MQEYIDNGARLGWLIDPIEKRAYIYHPDQPVEVLDNPSALSGDPVLPGFVFPVHDVVSNDTYSLLGRQGVPAAQTQGLSNERMDILIEGDLNRCHRWGGEEDERFCLSGNFDDCPGARVEYRLDERPNTMTSTLHGDERRRRIGALPP